MSVLKEILSGVTSSRSVLISDSANFRGDQILGGFMQKFSKNGTKVVALIFDETQSPFVHFSNVTCRKVLPNKESWINSGAEQISLACFLPAEGKVSVVIHSLSSALLKFDVEDLYKQLHNIINNDDVLQLVCHLHQDISDPRDIKFLRSCFSTFISVEPPIGRQKYPTFSLEHYKTNGKFFTDKRIFYQEANGKLKILPLVQEKDEKPQPADAVSQPIHDSFSTFRHSLNSEEQKARENLVLPYQRMTLDGLPPRGHGKIEYEPEDDDEWDEEDPDDDLEI
ncbi:elongator complex protein 5 [Neocloeon triangulifer]|uniref:elongator complex protein 5 n=1 Tax=Neocloeon triangulifer TaxID=2078957 RepID=UPI00286F2B74|nr:elongator complex protein 5 [Neocloeon triangulifer]XP_059486659.1 elongator complex protein 5 [Neocloeon triangulifer]